jgi:hypothetical protein
MYHNVMECKVKPTMTLDPHFSDYLSLTFIVFGDWEWCLFTKLQDGNNIT